MPFRASLLVLVLFVASPLRAAVVFSTFAGGPGLYNTLNGSQTLNSYEGAISFVPTASGPLENITLKVEGFSGTTNATLSFTLNGGSNKPGAQIESWPLTNIVASPNGGLQTVTSALHPSLVQGTKYWVILSPTNGSVGWYLNALNVHGDWRFSNDGRQTWISGNPSDTPDGALEITTSAVPESTSIALLATIALAAVLITKRHSA